MLDGWYRSPGDARSLVAHDGQDPEILLAQTKAYEPAARKRAGALVDAFLTRVAQA